MLEVTSVERVILSNDTAQAGSHKAQDHFQTAIEDLQGWRTSLVAI